MDRGYVVGPHKAQQVVVASEQTGPTGFVEIKPLNHSAHGTIEDEYAPAQNIF